MQLRNIDVELIEAVRFNKKKKVRLLIKKGADVNCRNEFASTPLHLAASNPCNRLEMVRILISSGAEVNFVNKYGKTPLHLAVHHLNIGIAEYLLEYGASRIIKDNNGLRPFDIAVLCNYEGTGGCEKVFEMLKDGIPKELLNSENCHRMYTYMSYLFFSFRRDIFSPRRVKK